MRIEKSGDTEEMGNALVLSAGGVRGIAHVGAWKALREAGVPISRIVGNSIGALVGAAIATGVSMEKLEERARTLRRSEIAVPWRWPWWARRSPRPGLLRGDVLLDFVESILPDRPEERLLLPLDVGAVDLSTGEIDWFSFRPEGEESSVDGGVGGVGLVDAVMASMAIPVFFPPVRIGERSYVDGGVLAPLPIRRAADLGARRVLAVDVTSDDEAEPTLAARRNLLQVSLRTLAIATSARCSWHASAPMGCDVTRIRPDVDHVACLDFACTPWLLKEGHRVTRAVVDKMRMGAPNVPAARAMAG